MAFLGIVDEKIRITTDQEQCSHLDNKIGGQPFFNPSFDVNKYLECNYFNCKKCSKCLTFLLQINCPIDDSNDNRILYVFACLNKNCDDKPFRIFRIVTKAKETIECDSKLFDDGWDDDNEFENFEDPSEINKATNDENKTEYNLKKFSKFIPYYISVIEEPNESINIEKYEKMVKNQIENGDENFAAEQYEKHYPDVFENDKDNYKFYKQLSKCPEQIIRYEWLGTPIKPSNKTNFTIRNCENCGSRRIYEFQLMPSLIHHSNKNFIKQNNLNDNEEIIMDFETIIVFTCIKNCFSSNNYDNYNIHEEQSILCKENVDCSAILNK